MLRNNHIPILHLGLQALKNLNSPTTLLKRLTLTLRLLRLSRMIPSHDKTIIDLLMKSVIDGDFVFSCEENKFLDVGESVGFLHGGSDAGVELPGWVEEVVVWVDEDNGGFAGGVWEGGHCESCRFWWVGR